MFEIYKVFIKNTLDSLFHRNNSFAGYFDVVFNSMLLLISFLLIAIISTSIIIMPFILYKKIMKKIEAEKQNIYKFFDGNDTMDGRDKSLELDRVRRKQYVYIFIYILLMIIIYLPLIVPLILILFDILGYAIILVICLILLIIAMFIAQLYSWHYF